MGNIKRIWQDVSPKSLNLILLHFRKIFYFSNVYIEFEGCSEFEQVMLHNHGIHEKQSIPSIILQYCDIGNTVYQFLRLIVHKDLPFSLILDCFV